MSAGSNVMLEPDDLAACPGLDQVRKELSAFARLTRPLLVRGDEITVRALVRSVSSGQPLAEVACCLMGSDGAGLRDLLAARRVALGSPGLLLLLDVDGLQDGDHDYLRTVVRTGVLDARGSPLNRRLVFHMGAGRAWQPDRPGLFLDVNVPPLADRLGDAAVLFSRLLARCVGEGLRLDEDAARALETYPWPGGMHEVIMRTERLAALHAGDVPSSVSLIEIGIPAVDQPRSRRGVAASGSLKTIMRAYEKEVLRETLIRLKGNKSHAARELEISRSYLIQKCQAYGVVVAP